MNRVTVVRDRAELARLMGGRNGRKRPKDAEPTMLPTNGLTPAITTPGPKTYLCATKAGAYVAAWDDDRARVPVTFLTWEEWARGKRS